MKTVRGTTFFLLLLTLFGCSRQFHIAKLIPGRTYFDQAIDRLGEPEFQKDVSVNEQIYIWRDVTVQAKDDVIVVVQRKPANYESSLQFWRQQYKASPQNFSKVTESSYTAEHLWQLNLPKQKMNIIYDETKDKVIKVMHYHVD